MTRICPPHYSPFGSLLPNRSWSDGNRGYRFGFNNQEEEGLGDSPNNREMPEFKYDFEGDDD